MEFKEIIHGVKVEWSKDKDGAYKIIKFKKGSRTVVIIQDIYRGQGWNDKSQKYVGVHYHQKGQWTGWCLGENFSYGTQYETHIKELTPFQGIKKVERDSDGCAIIKY